MELRTLGLARVLFGALLLLRTTPLLAPFDVALLRDARPLLGWPSDRFHVGALGLALPAGVVAGLCVVRTIAAALFTVGVRAREAGVVAGACAYLVLAQDAFAYVNTLHLLFEGTVVLAVAGSGGSLAVSRERPIDPRSGLLLARAFVASVYAWSGVAKLNAAWLGGAALEHLHRYGVVRGALAHAVLRSHAGAVACAWGVASFELALGPLLLWRRTRAIALVGAFVFHAVLQGSVEPDFFGFAMGALLVVFWDQRQSPSQRAASAGQTTSP